MFHSIFNATAFSAPVNMVLLIEPSGIVVLASVLAAQIKDLLNVLSKRFERRMETA